MSVHTPRQERLTLWATMAHEVSREMTAQKWLYVKEIFATAVLAVLVWEAMRSGYPVSASIGMVGIGAINTITAGQLYRAIREVQAENREDFAEQ